MRKLQQSHLGESERVIAQAKRMLKRKCRRAGIDYGDLMKRAPTFEIIAGPSVSDVIAGQVRR